MAETKDMDKDEQVKQVATNVVESLAAIEESFRLAKLELLKRETELFKPLYSKREKLTSAIPHFWSTVLSIEDELTPYIQEGEADLLKSCTSFRIERVEQDPRDFSLYMTFSRNAYLEDASCSVVKDFKFDGGRLTSRIVKMDWKKGKDLPALAAADDRLSFFSLFSFVGTAEEETEEDAEIDEDDPQLVLEDMAMLLADEVYPHALSYFTDALLPPPSSTTSSSRPGSPSLDAQNGMVPESMTTSFLDQQERVTAAAAHGTSEQPNSIGMGKSHMLSGSTKNVETYASSASTALDDTLALHRSESIEAFNEVKMITLNEAQFLHFFTAQMGVKRVLEIGTFTGYSAMVFARAGAEEVLTCEIDASLASFAKLGVHRAGLSDCVKVLLGDAHKSVSDKGLVQGRFDLIFIDAEKEGYVDYLKTIMERKLLSERGVIVADNTLRRGCVATMEMPPRQYTAESREQKLKNDDFESGVKAIREFNDFLMAQKNLESVLIPAWDGCTLIRHKREG